MRDLDDRRFLDLLEAAPDAMVCVERDGRIALVNAQAEKLFGYGRDELVGQPVEMLVPEAVSEFHPRHRARYCTDPRPRPIGQGMELAGRRDGSTFPADGAEQGPLSVLDLAPGYRVSTITVYASDGSCGNGGLS